MDILFHRAKWSIMLYLIGFIGTWFLSKTWSHFRCMKLWLKTRERTLSFCACRVPVCLISNWPVMKTLLLRYSASHIPLFIKGWQSTLGIMDDIIGTVCSIRRWYHVQIFLLLCLFDFNFFVNTATSPLTFKRIFVKKSWRHQVYLCRTYDPGMLGLQFEERLNWKYAEPLCRWPWWWLLAGKQFLEAFVLAQLIS